MEIKNPWRNNSKIHTFCNKNFKKHLCKRLGYRGFNTHSEVSIIKAVNMYDISKGNGFTTYVTNSIKRTLYTLIRDNVKKTSYCSLNSINEEGCELIDILVSDENIRRR